MLVYRFLPKGYAMSAEMYLAFVTATLVLMLIPGPNVALIMANSVAHGRKYGLITVAGTSCAMIPQLALTIFGMTATLTLLSHLFEWVRWLGVAYLLYLGLQAWRAQPVNLAAVRPDPRAVGRIFLRGFLVSLTNPKTLLFYGAFLPQFVSPGGSLAGQLSLLSFTFLGIAILVDSCWALAAARFQSVLSLRGTLRNRLTATFYFAAAMGLAAARKPS